MNEFFICLMKIFKNFKLNNQVTKKDNQEKQRANQNIPVENTHNTAGKVSVSLCLIVTASVVYNLEKNSELNTNKLKEIIDNASYFVCNKTEILESLDHSLPKNNEDIKNVNERKRIYLRINLYEGDNMINKDNQYSLKENLLSTTKGTVEEIFCLEYLSGLEAFNRI